MRMGEIAYAEDMAKLSAAVEALKQVPVWNQNKPLCDWFLRTWLQQQKDREPCPITRSYYQAVWNIQEWKPKN